MPDITISLTSEDLKRLHKKAAEERRTVENMASYLVAKALEPKRPVMRKTARKAKSVGLAIERLDRASARIQGARREIRRR